MIGERTIDGVPALTLASEAVGGIEAAIVPGAGMVVCSLRHRGEELLGQRGGLRKYMEHHSTMGIPLLYPWANRVSQDRFAVAGRTVDLGLADPAPSRDPAGLPIHGLLGAARGWQVESHSARPDGGVLEASFDFAAHPGLTDAFPFPHELLFAAELRGPDAVDHDHGLCRTRSARPDRVRIPPVLPPPRSRASRMGGGGPGRRADGARRSPAPDRRTRAGRGRPRRARRPDLRRRVRRAARAAAVRPRRRRTPDRGRVHARFPLRPGLRTGGRRRDRLRADDGPHQRTRHRWFRVAALAGGRPPSWRISRSR